MNGCILQMIYFDKINVSEELMLIKQANQNGAIFVTISLFQVNALCFNQMSAIDAMIY